MMTDYKTHTVESAPEASKAILKTVRQKLGFVPNLMATMAESPVMVEAYLTLMGLFDRSTLSETERQVVLMTNNRLNGCTYCMAAHTAVSKMAGVDDGVIDALRAGAAIDDPKLEELRSFSIVIHETHGRPTAAQIEAFLAAGYTKETILEVILGTSLKVLSNYTTPITAPRLDDGFASMAWTPDEVTAA